MSENTKDYMLGSPHIKVDGTVCGKGSIIALSDLQAKKLVNKVTLVVGATVDGEVTAKAETVVGKTKTAVKTKNDAKDNDGF